MIRASIRIGAMAMFGLASAIPGASQDMMQHVDLTSPEMASAEMTRADVEAAIAPVLLHASRRPLRGTEYSAAATCASCSTPISISSGRP